MTASSASLSGGTPAPGPSVQRRASPSRTRSIDRGGCGAAGAARAASATSHTGVGVGASGVHGRSERLEVGLARQRGIERFEPSGGIEKERRSVAAAREDERDLRAQSLQPGALKLVQRGDLGGRQQRLGGLAASRLELGLRGGERPRAASAGSGVSSAARSRNAAAAAMPPRRRARPAERSSSSATVSSRPAAACARCHARRSGSTCGSVASASARWTS